jgi:hypothetical protein
MGGRLRRDRCTEREGTMSPSIYYGSCRKIEAKEADRFRIA